MKIKMESRRNLQKLMMIIMRKFIFAALNGI